MAREALARAYAALLFVVAAASLSLLLGFAGFHGGSFLAFALMIMVPVAVLVGVNVAGALRLLGRRGIPLFWLRAALVVNAVTSFLLLEPWDLLDCVSRACYYFYEVGIFTAFGIAGLFAFGYGIRAFWRTA